MGCWLYTSICCRCLGRECRRRRSSGLSGGTGLPLQFLFDIFNVLNPERIWFDEPYDEEIKVSICDKSGHLASENCEATTGRYVPASCSQSSTCPYHQLVYLSADKKHRVHSDCESPARMQQANYFILPPTQSWYYRKKHPAYQSLPDYRSDGGGQMMQQQEIKIRYCVSAKWDENFYSDQS